MTHPPQAHSVQTISALRGCPTCSAGPPVCPLFEHKLSRARSPQHPLPNPLYCRVPAPSGTPALATAVTGLGLQPCRAPGGCKGCGEIVATQAAAGRALNISAPSLHRGKPSWWRGPSTDRGLNSCGRVAGALPAAPAGPCRRAHQYRVREMWFYSSSDLCRRS